MEYGEWITYLWKVNQWNQRDAQHIWKPMAIYFITLNCQLNLDIKNWRIKIQKIPNDNVHTLILKQTALSLIN